MTPHPGPQDPATPCHAARRAVAAAALALAATATTAAPVYHYEIFTCGPWAQASTCGSRPLSRAFSFTTDSILSVPTPPVVPANQSSASDPVEWNVLSQEEGSFSRATMHSWQNIFGTTGWQLSLFDPAPAHSLGQTTSHLSISPFASDMLGRMSLGLGVWDGMVSASCQFADARGVCHASTTVQSMLVIAVTMVDPPPPGVPEPASALLAALGLIGLPAARRLAGRARGTSAG